MDSNGYLQSINPSIHQYLSQQSFSQTLSHNSVEEFTHVNCNRNMFATSCYAIQGLLVWRIHVLLIIKLLA